MVYLVGGILTDINQVFIFPSQLTLTPPPTLGVLLLLVPIQLFAQELQVLRFLHIAVVLVTERCRYGILYTEIKTDLSVGRLP